MAMTDESSTKNTRDITDLLWIALGAFFFIFGVRELSSEASRGILQMALGAAACLHPVRNKPWATPVGFVLVAIAGVAMIVFLITGVRQ